MQAAQRTFKPIPSAVRDVNGNAVTRGKIELGKMLFFDPRLSASQIISCNSCHNLSTGGVNVGPTSIGQTIGRIRLRFVSLLAAGLTNVSSPAPKKLNFNKLATLP